MGIKEALRQMCMDTIDATNQNMMDGIGKLLGGVDDKLGSLITSATDPSGAFGALQTLATSLMICLFLIRFAESAFKDKQDPDSLFKDIAWLLLFSTIILNLPGLISGFQDIASSIVTKVQGSITSPGSYTPATQEEISDLENKLKNKSTLILLLDAALYAIVLPIASSIVQIIVAIAVYTVQIEIFIRTLLAPIGVAFLAEPSGFSGAGGRYIKGWVACYIQIAIMNAAFYAYQFVNTASMGGQGTLLVSLLAGGFAVAGFCMKSASIAREICGT